MTGRNRRQRLSDPMRSVLWYMARGYELHRETAHNRRTAWVARPEEPDATRMAIAYLVVDALVERGIVEGRASGRYELTREGAKVAEEIRRRIDGEGVSRAG
jgi:hypothetical protein